MSSTSRTRRRRRSAPHESVRPEPTDPFAVQPEPAQADPGQLAEAIALAVCAHPAVAGLDGGPYGAIACYLPSRQVVGVRVGEPGAPVAVSVVVRFGLPLPQLAIQLREVITSLTGPRVIDLTINDVITGVPPPSPESSLQHGR